MFPFSTPTVQQQFFRPNPTSSFIDMNTGLPTSSPTTGSNPYLDSANYVKTPDFATFNALPTVDSSGNSTGSYPNSTNYGTSPTGVLGAVSSFGDGYGGTFQTKQEADASKAAKDSIRSGINVASNNYKSGAQTGLRDVTNEYDAKSRSFIDSMTQGQNDINTGMATNQLNLRRSMADIVKMVQNGMRSGGVALANMNAGQSGATDAMARAWAAAGNKQATGASNQAGLQQEDLMKQQGQLNLKKSQAEGDMNTWKSTETDRVKNDFASKLATLKSQADAQGAGDAVDTSLVDQVLNDALAKLAAIDQSRQSQISGVQQWSPEQVMQEAIRLDNLGVTGNPFTIQSPQVAYGGVQPGAATTAMPLYVKNKDQLTVVPTKKTQQ